MTKLNTFGLSRALTTLRLQGEDSEEISNDADTDDILRSLAAAEMVAPRFRWRRSRWGRLCPVELYNGSIVNGSPQYAVRYGYVEDNLFSTHTMFGSEGPFTEANHVLCYMSIQCLWC